MVGGGRKPQYLLDVGPPIQYAPSATILMNWAERRRPRDAGAARVDRGRLPLRQQPAGAGHGDVLAK